MSKKVYAVKRDSYNCVNKKLFFDSVDHIFSSLNEASCACMDLAIYSGNHSSPNKRKWTYFSNSWNLEWGTEDPKYGYIQFKDGDVVKSFYVECVEMD